MDTKDSVNAEASKATTCTTTQIQLSESSFLLHAKSALKTMNKKTYTQTVYLNATKLSVYDARCFLCFTTSTDRCSANPRHRSI